MKLGDTKHKLSHHRCPVFRLAKDGETVLNSSDYKGYLARIDKLQLSASGIPYWRTLYWKVPTDKECAPKLNWWAKWRLKREQQKALPKAKVVKELKC